MTPKNIARHEVHVTLDQVVAAAEHALKPGGSFYMIHKPFRLAEIFECLHEHRLEPKRMQLVHPYIDKEPNMVIVEAVKGGNSMIKIDPTKLRECTRSSCWRRMKAVQSGNRQRLQHESEKCCKHPNVHITDSEVYIWQANYIWWQHP